MVQISWEASRIPQKTSLLHLDLTIALAIGRQLSLRLQVHFGRSAVLTTYPSTTITGCEESLWIHKETKSVFFFLNSWGWYGGMVPEQRIFKEYFLLYSSSQKQKLPAQPAKHTSSTEEQFHMQDTCKASMKFAALLLVHVRSYPWLAALPLSNYPLELPQLSPVLCIYLIAQLPGSVLRNCG